MPEIIFLTETRPLTGKVADWLISQAGDAAPLDLSDTALIVSTTGAGRRLRDELVFRAQQADTGLLPPVITTPFGLIDAALSEPVASRGDRLMAWADALSGAEETAAGLLPGFTPPLSTRDALRIAESLMDVCAVLAEGGLTPRSREIPARLPLDEERWQLLAELYGAYLKRLRQASLVDPNEARLEGVREGLAAPSLRRVVVAGVPDLNALSRRYLTRLQELGLPVVVLVDAPACEDARFDAWGSPEETSWSSLALPLGLGDVTVAADAFSEAEVAAGLLAGEPAVGLCLIDEQLAPSLESALARRGLSSFDPRGEPLAATEVAVLVSAWMTFCRSRLLTDLRLLVECPAFLRALARADDLSSVGAQRLYDRACQETLMDFWPDVVAFYRQPREGEKEEANRRRVLPFISGVEAWRRDFDLGAPRQSLQRFLGRIYAEERVVAGSREEAALRAYAALLAEPWLAPDSDTEWEVLQDAVQAAKIYGPHDPEAVEFNGWLEAPWLPQEFLVLSGCVEGVLPSAIVGHPFLPDTARQALGLATNAQRLARDTYLLHNLLATRAPGAVKLLYGRQNAEGDPVKPSRLLLRCAEDELPTRVRGLFREVTSLRHTPPRARHWKLDVLRGEPLKSVPVTGFGDYLTCPFRFYLKHVLKMQPFEAGALEMDAREFGIIFHKVVEVFSKDLEICDSQNPFQIEEYVHRQLDRLVLARHGRRPSLPVRVQQESLRVRLSQFARLQAAEREAGWRIVEAEYRFTAEDTRVLGGLPVVASLDRVEVHEGTGRRRILDYKTFARDKTPDKTHFGAKASDPLLPGEEILWDGKMRYWRNLQLPLYRALAEYRWPDLSAPPIIGYFLLPERVEDSRIEEFPLDDFTGHAAVQCAEALAERMARNIFWPPRPVEFDDYEALFLDESPEAVLTEESIAFLSGELS